MSKKREESINNIRAAFLEAVEIQLRDNDPAETRLALARLLSEGLSDAEAKDMIADVIKAETMFLLLNKETFNRKRYAEKLNQLTSK